eukprot:symbB.v1.2.016799.t1/scaffold1270.1/size227213/11
MEAQDMGGAVQEKEVGPVKPQQDGFDPSQRKMASDYVGGDWKTFWDFLPDKEDPFLYSTDGRRPLSFKELKAFIVDEKNDLPGMGREDRLCLVFPTGPELAVAYLAFAVRCAVAPLNLFLRARDPRGCENFQGPISCDRIWWRLVDMLGCWDYDEKFGGTPWKN